MSQPIEDWVARRSKIRRRLAQWMASRTPELLAKDRDQGEIYGSNGRRIPGTSFADCVDQAEAGMGREITDPEPWEEDEPIPVVIHGSYSIVDTWTHLDRHYPRT